MDAEIFTKRKKKDFCFSGLVFNSSINAEEIYKIAEESVCPVLFEINGEKIANGSSFIYKQCIRENGSKLYFFTNLHVIQTIHDLIRILKSQKSQLQKENFNYRVYVKYKGKDYDIDTTFVPPVDIYKVFLLYGKNNIQLSRFDFSVFIIETDDVQPVKYFGIKYDSNIVIGSRVWALGYPKGLELAITDGIISHIYDRHNLLDEGENYYGMIQHNILINPGNSGGPTVNEYGEVVGISTFERIDSVGINFSLNIDFIIELMRTDFLKEFNIQSYISNRI